MADLTYYNYPGVGEQNRQRFSYSQAVRVGDLIYCSGQGKAARCPLQLVYMLDTDTVLTLGGWKPEGPVNKIVTETNAQIDQAFETVDFNLKHAGSKGWSQVFSVNSFHVPLNNEANEAMVRNFRKWCPDHQPTYTCVGVQRLGEDDMRVEIQVIAYDPEGAKAGREKGAEAKA